MKSNLALVFSLAFFPVLHAQTPDSLAIRQVDSIIQVSLTFTRQGEYGQALETIAIAENIALEKLGRESLAFGSCCHNFGRIAYFMSEYKDAEKWYHEALTIRETVLNKEHPDILPTLNNLALLYRETGNLEETEKLYVRAAAIQEKVFGKDHPGYAESLNNLGILYAAKKQYEQAEKFGNYLG
jgi:tetratricopeptide (TPR) repeat protein